MNSVYIFVGSNMVTRIFVCCLFHDMNQTNQRKIWCNIMAVWVVYFPGHVQMTAVIPWETKFILQEMLNQFNHYTDVTMCVMAPKITRIYTVCWSGSSGAYQRKHQNSVWLAFVMTGGFFHKWSVTQKVFPIDNVIMIRVTDHTLFKNRAIHRTVFWHLKFDHSWLVKS